MRPATFEPIAIGQSHIMQLHVESNHAHRVERLALKLFEQLADGDKAQREYPI